MPRSTMSKKSTIAEKRSQYKRKTKMEKWGGNALWYEDIATMSKQALEKFLKKVIQQTNRRLVSLNRQNVDSFAAYKLGEELKNFSPEQLGTMTRQKLSSVISAYHDFWSARSSTAQGAKQINKEQDIRIFGAVQNIRGEDYPIYQMTEEQRRLFWATYMEFYNQNKDIIEGKDNSERIQRLIGKYIHDIAPGDFITAIAKVRIDFEQEQLLEEARHQFDAESQEVINIVKGNM